MSNKTDLRMRYLEQPIFHLCVLKDYVLIASGGGGKKFAVRNKIISYKINSDYNFSEKMSYEVEYEKEIPVYINSLEAYNIFCTCLDNLTIFYKLNPSNGEFEEIYTQKVMDYFDADNYQTVCKFDEKGEYFASGTTDGNLKLWKINFTPNGNFSLTLLKEKSPHLKSINDIIFMEDLKLLATVSSDGSCKIFELPTLNQLKKLTFRADLTERQNYSMRGIRYNRSNRSLFTIQSPKKGGTYLTKWDAGRNFEPVSTIIVSDTICTSMDFSRDYNLIGLGDCKGSLIYVDASADMSVIKEVFLSEITIKSVVFKKGNLISGTADNSLKLNFIYKRNLISLFGIIKVLMMFAFFYHLFTKLKKTHHLDIKI